MPVATVRGTGQARAVPGAGEKELGRAGRDDQPGRVAPAVVELLTAGRLERDHQLDRARARSSVGGRWVCRAGPSTSCASAGMAHADQAVGRGLHDHEPGRARRRPTRRPRRSARRVRWPASTPGSSPGRTDGSPRCRCRRPRRSRRAARRRRAGAANRASPAGPSRCPKSNRPVPTCVVSPSADQVRRADVSESATHTRRPSADVASPEGWASQAVVARSVPQTLLRRSRRAPRAGLAPGRGRASGPRAGGSRPWPRRPGRPTRPGPTASRGPASSAGPPASRRRSGVRSRRRRGSRCQSTRSP